MASMDKIRERQKFKRRLYSRTTRIILLLVLLFLIKPTWSVYQKQKESAENLARAEKELAELKAKQDDLSVKIEDINSEAGRDRVIREKFGVAKEGETAIVIVKNKDGQVEAGEEKQGFFGRIWRAFMSIFR